MNDENLAEAGYPSHVSKETSRWQAYEALPKKDNETQSPGAQAVACGL